MDKREFCSIAIRQHYERIIKVDIDDPQWNRSGGLKSAFRPAIPEICGVKRYDLIPASRPVAMIWRDGNGRQIPDFIQQHYECYSAKVREIVEEWQPNVLGWVPVKFTYSRGGRTEDRFFIDQRTVPTLDLVDVVASNMCWIEEARALRPAKDFSSGEHPLPPHADPNRASQLHFRRDAIVSEHIFKVKGLSEGHFISPELRDAFDAAGVTGAQFNPVAFGLGTTPAPAPAPILRAC